MNKLVGTYRFVRAANSASGFLSQNRASTDARNVLENWRAMSRERNFTIKAEEDEELVAVLTFESEDQAAGSQMGALCEKYGVDYHPMS